MTRLRGIRERVGHMDPDRFDRWIAVLFGMACAVDVATRAAQHEHRGVTAVAVALIVVLLLWRRRAPVAAVTILSVILIVQELLHGGVTRNGTVPFAVLIVLYYSVGAYADGGRFVAGGVIASVGLMIDLAIGVKSGAPSGVVFGLLFVWVPAGIGRALRNRKLLAAAMQEKLEATEREREEQARQAIEDERARISRELHDLVAHSISAMTVQADAVAGVADRYPVQAKDSLAAIENTGRDALTEMRRLLGVLRKDDETLTLHPQPTLSEVGVLLDRARRVGLEVQLETEGEAAELPAGVDLAAYRVIQEALASTADQPGARRVLVGIRYGDRDLRVQVTDDRVGDGAPVSGTALLGLRERVGLYGGDLEVGRRRDGYVVTARLPRELVTA